MVALCKGMIDYVTGGNLMGISFFFLYSLEFMSWVSSVLVCGGRSLEQNYSTHSPLARTAQVQAWWLGSFQRLCAQDSETDKDLCRRAHKHTYDHTCTPLPSSELQLSLSTSRCLAPRSRRDEREPRMCRSS